jgi:hypothetical protein
MPYELWSEVFLKEATLENFTMVIFKVGEQILTTYIRDQYILRGKQVKLKWILTLEEEQCDEKKSP